MPSDRPPTTIRFSEEDKEILAKLQKVTGLDSASSVVRLAIREALSARETNSKARGKR
jgi:Arc/MetJ family transcription regulator